MKKIAMSVAAATMLIGGLTACGTADKEATDMKANYRQTGFEAQDVRDQNNIRYRSEGPITDMMTPDDRYRKGTNGRYEGTRTRINNYNNNGMARNGYGANEPSGFTGDNRPGMVGEDGMLRGRARNGVMNNQSMNSNDYGSRNYTKNTGRSNSKFHAMNYNENYDSKTAQRIANKVTEINGIDDARVIVHKNDVVIGVDTRGMNNNVRQEVEQKVRSLTKDKNVHVVTDSDAVGRIRTMDNQLRTGTGFDEIGSTFSDMLRDIGDAVQRPFER